MKVFLLFLKSAGVHTRPAGNSGIKDLTCIYNGLGIVVLSTPQGVLSDNEARRQSRWRSAVSGI